MRRLSILLLAAMTCLPAMTARAADPTPAPGPAQASVPDSTGAELVGIWASTADSTGTVSITAWEPGIYSIHAAGRFTAVGFYDGKTFTGVTRAPERFGAAPHHFGALRFEVPKEKRIVAEFRETPGDSTARREQWTFQSSFGHEASLKAAADSLPKFGERVDVETLPEPIEQPAPDYPEWARKKGVEGVVMVQALIGKDGLVKDMKIAKSIPELDDYARAAVRQWRFKPAQAKGAPVAVWVAIPVSFRLK